MPSAGSLMCLSFSLNFITQYTEIRGEAFVCLYFGQFPHIFPFPAAGAILPLNQSRILLFIFFLQLFYLWPLLKPGKVEFAFRSSGRTWPEPSDWSCSVKEPLFWNTMSACLEERFSPLIVSGFKNLHPCIMLKQCTLPSAWFPHLFILSICLIFGASPPGYPGQSRHHTLLPKRPRCQGQDL
jgi:hypothetical protein